MKIGPYETHWAADVFPMMEQDLFAELVESMRNVGFDERHPVMLTPQGLVLDGRNRLKAALDAGVEPVFARFTGSELECWPFVWRENAQRRDLGGKERRAVIFTLGNERWLQERAEVHAKAKAEKLAAVAAVQIASKPRDSKGRVVQDAAQIEPHPGPLDEESGDDGEQPRPEPFKRSGGEHHARQEVAAACGVSQAGAERAIRLVKANPELARAVAAGEVKPSQAMRELKREAIAEAARLPDAKYRVIYADPPWQYSDSRVGVAQETAAADHYPTMSIAQLEAMPVKDLAMEDAVLLCWATFPLLPDALRLVKAWGFTYKTAFVWDKDRPNLGNYHNASAELLLVCARGSAVPETSERQDQVQVVRREGRHSEKPEHFRRLIDELWPSGKRIELFRRGQAPEGWEVWGNEAV